MRFKALYTKQLTKKQKAWIDGFVDITEADSLVLQDEAGTSLSSTRRPKPLQLHGGYEELLTCFEGYLVQIDGEAEEANGTAAQPAQVESVIDKTSHLASKSRVRGSNSGPATVQQPNKQISRQVYTKTWQSNKIDLQTEDVDEHRLRVLKHSSAKQLPQVANHKWGCYDSRKPINATNNQLSTTTPGNRSNVTSVPPNCPAKVDANHLNADAQSLLAWLGIDPSASTALMTAPLPTRNYNSREAVYIKQDMPVSIPTVWGLNEGQQKLYIDKPQINIANRCHQHHNQQQHHQHQQQCAQGHNHQQQGPPGLTEHQASPCLMLPQHSEVDTAYGKHPTTLPKLEHINDQHQEATTLQQAEVITDMPLAKRARAVQHVNNAAGDRPALEPIGTAAAKASNGHSLRLMHDMRPGSDQPTTSWSNVKPSNVTGVVKDAPTAALVTDAVVDLNTYKARTGFTAPRLNKSATDLQPCAPKLVANNMNGSVPCASPFLGITIPPMTVTPAALSKPCYPTEVRQPQPYQQSLQRNVVIPTGQYHNTLEYMRTLQQALTEEINLRIAEAAQTLQDIILEAVRLLQNTSHGGNMLHGPASDGFNAQHTVAAGGFSRPSSNTQQSAHLGSAIERACEKLRHPYFAGAQLSVYKPSKFHGVNNQRKSHKAGGKRKANRHAGSDDSSADENPTGKAAVAKPGMRVFLTISQARTRIKEFRRQDLWFLSSHPLLNPSNNSQAGYPRTSLLVARSLWHGPDKTGKIEVEILTPVTANLPKNQEVYAWRGPDVQTELQTLQLLHAAWMNPLAYGVPTTLNSSDLAKVSGGKQGSWGTGNSTEQQAAPVPGASIQKHATSVLTHLLNMDVPYHSMHDVRNVGTTTTKRTPARKALKIIKTKTVPLPTQLPQQATSPAQAGFCEEADDVEISAADTAFRPESQARVQDTKSITGSNASSDIPWPDLTSAGNSDELLAALYKQFTLNKDQQSVAQHVASWLRHPRESERNDLQNNDSEAGLPPSQAPNFPVCLIHGPFGSGKSTLLAALITLLVAARNLPGSPPCRILVAAHTNVAVDRVLLALQDRGFTSFLRVGSLPKIARSILCRSLHAADDSRDARSQLRSMLASETNDTERALLEQELADLEAGHERQRRKLLSTSPVVGTTCAALLQSDVWELAGHFSVVVLDECSQMTEPTSLIPLLKAQPSFLIAAGDPLQLPPVIANPTQLTATPALRDSATTSGLDSCVSTVTNQAAHQGAACPTEQHGLKRPLFVRLQHLGHPVHLLGIQYRCHPTIAYVPNHLFYGGRLSDGCTASQRHAIPAAPSLPALSMCELPDGSQALVDPRTYSCYNIAEAQHVVQVLTALVAAGVDNSQLGVICFYKAQVAKIRHLLQGPGTSSALSVQVATVDSFQGAEKDVIILATTMTRTSQAEFVGDPCRLVVALTRARRHLIAFGVSRILSSASPAFARVVSLCKSASNVAQADLPHGSMGYFALGSLLQRIESYKVVAAAASLDCPPPASADCSPVAHTTGSPSSLNASMSSQNVCSEQEHDHTEGVCADVWDAVGHEENMMLDAKDISRDHGTADSLMLAPALPPQHSKQQLSWYARSHAQQNSAFVESSMPHQHPHPAALQLQPVQSKHQQLFMLGNTLHTPNPVSFGFLTTAETNHVSRPSVSNSSVKPALAHAQCSEFDCDDDELWDSLDEQGLQEEQAPGFSFVTHK